MIGGKDIENRDWFAPRALFGQRIAIHSSKRLEESEIDRWLNEPKINIEQVKILSESKIDAHLIDKRIINSKNPNCKEVQAFYKEDFMQGSLF